MSEARMRLELEIGASDSSAMESVVASGVTVISDDKSIFRRLIGLLFPSKLQRRVVVEIGVGDLAMLHSIINTNGLKLIADSEDTRKAFHISTKEKSYEMCKMLLKCGIVDVGARDEDGGTPLHHAARYGEVELCQDLIEAGSDVNEKHNYGWTALMEAVWEGHEKIVRLLIEAGCDVNRGETNMGETALIWAAENGHEKLVRLLIEAGSDVSQKNNAGENAIMYSASNGHVQSSRILLENGIDITAIKETMEYVSHEETIELLEYATRLHRTTLFIHCIEYLRNHRQEYEEEELREYIPDHVMNGFFRNTIWKKRSIIRII